AKMDNRIQVIHQQNKGLGPSRNQGLEQAMGDYIVFVDSDDWINANKLLALYCCAENHNAEMVLGDFQYCFENEKTSKSYINLQDHVNDVVNYGESILESYKKGCTFVSMAWAYILSREFICRCKLQFDNIIHEDELWTTKALCLADRVVFTRICFYNYFQRDDSIMASTPSGKRISSLFYIAYALLLFGQHQIKNSEKGNKAFLEFILLRVSELYKTAFNLLSKIKDSSIVVPSHHLRSLYYNIIFLRGNTRQRYLNNYRASISFLREYNNWKRSVWVRGINKKMNNEDKLILVYNLMWDCPLDIPIARIPAGYRFTTDRKYFNDADMVVFHLPTLRENIDVDLEKPEFQKWVGWSLECEENYPFMKDDDFMSVFDYKMTYHQNSDIVFPYYEANLESAFRVPLDNKRTKDICMLISSPFNKSNRKEYLKELM
ncbi:MAG: glycosyltransferase, partial [Tannerellaceae bacterium]